VFRQQVITSLTNLGLVFTLRDLCLSNATFIP